MSTGGDLADQRVTQFLSSAQGTLRTNVEAMRAVPGLSLPEKQAYARGMDKLQAQMTQSQADAGALENERRAAFRASFSEPVLAGR